MGAVYEATHARLAGRYAIKLLLLKPTVGSEAIALFDREARITSLLQHPNIVQVIDHNTTADGTEYLVMEYLAGESLAQRLVREGAASSRHRRRNRRPDRGGAGGGPRLSRRSPRSQAGQRVPGAGRGAGSRVGQDPGLRDLEGEGLELGPSGARRDGDGHAALHGARADRGARGGRGRRDGSVRARRDRLRDAHRPHSLPGRHGRRGLRAGSPHRSAADGLGRDVELVVRRGLAKSNRQRFPAITDFSDALRAAAAGRLRETQWAATLAYAAGEVASHDSKGRSGRRLRRVVLALAAAASIALAFVVGGVWNQSLVASSARRPGRGGAGPRRDRGTTRRPGSAAESRDAQAAESSDAQEEEAAEPREEIEVAPEPPSPSEPETRPRHVRRPALGATPRRAASADSLTPDDDATLPATEPSN